MVDRNGGNPGHRLVGGASVGHYLLGDQMNSWFGLGIEALLCIIWILYARYWRKY
jgi:hypothetical protein